MSVSDRFVSEFGFLLPTQEFTMVNYLELSVIIAIGIVLIVYLSKCKAFEKVYKKIEWIF